MKFSHWLTPLFFLENRVGWRNTWLNVEDNNALDWELHSVCFGNRNYRIKWKEVIQVYLIFKIWNYSQFLPCLPLPHIQIQTSLIKWDFLKIFKFHLIMLLQWHSYLMFFMLPCVEHMVSSSPNHQDSRNHSKAVIIINKANMTTETTYFLLMVNWSSMPFFT